MKLTVQVSLVLLLLAGAVVFLTEAGVPQQSARWDAFLSESRHKRSANSWQGGGRRATCALQNLTADDTLGRRDSELLSRPQCQGRCGSCWAFAAAHTYTDHLSIRAGNLTDQLSPQYLAACLRERNGCCGAYVSSAFSFFQNMGAVTDSCAPYTLSEYEINNDFKIRNPIRNFCPDSCNDGTPFQPGNLSLHDYRELEENEVITALGTGPVAAEMWTTNRFSSYRCGVFCFDPTTDRRRSSAHAVEIVDYGTTSSGIDFWVVKNSWGSRWGENGYFRIRRGDLFYWFGTPVLSSSQPMTTTPPTDTMTCAPETVSDPSQDVMVMSAVDIALMQLNGRILCRDNSTATNITLTSVSNATAQVVEGYVFTLSIVVNVQGCMQPTQASVDAEVILYLNSTFELTGYTYQYIDDQVGGEDGGVSAITGNTILLLAATVMAVLTFGCY